MKASIKEWLVASWKWLAGAGAALVLLVGVYLAGKRTGSSQATINQALKELDSTMKQEKVLEKKLTVIQGAKKRVVGDILAEQLARAATLKDVDKLTNEEVTARLRDMGLLK